MNVLSGTTCYTSMVDRGLPRLFTSAEPLARMRMIEVDVIGKWFGELGILLLAVHGYEELTTEEADIGTKLPT